MSMALTIINFRYPIFSLLWFFREIKTMKRVQKFVDVSEVKTKKKLKIIESEIFSFFFEYTKKL